MKMRFSVVILCIVLVTGFLAGSPVLASEITKTTAVISSQPIFIDSIKIEMTMYNIKGNNYVRLRDIGQAMGFNVIYDAETRAIHIRTDELYSAASSALGQTPQSVDVSQTIQTLFIDGMPTYITAYNIAGNNYVKLVDLGDAVGFSVSWDSTNNRVMVESLNQQESFLIAPQDSTSTEAEAPAMTIEEMKTEIVRLTNVERVNAGLTEVNVLPELMDCAQAKADDMLKNHYYGHTSPVYGTFGEMIKSYVPQAKSCAENLAPWRKSPQEVIDGILDSPEHLKNMINPKYTHIGVGIIEGRDGGYWWVQQFVELP